MVLLWKADAGDEAGSLISFDGSTNADVVKFFFAYENVVMHGKSEEDKAAELLCYLQQEAFEFYCSTYGKECTLSDAANDFALVKRSMIYKFAQP